MRRLHAIVRGRVQGVGYRATAAHQAQRFAVAGWVRNLPDGSVEVLAEGGEPAVLGFLEFLRHGPGGARVAHVEADWAEATGDFSGFEIR